jgi:hypothetical protein
MGRIDLAKLTSIPPLENFRPEIGVHLFSGKSPFVLCTVQRRLFQFMKFRFLLISGSLFSFRFTVVSCLLVISFSTRLLNFK